MDPDAVSALVRDTLTSYRYDPPPPGTTIGVPWSPEKVYDHVEKLKAALLEEPYLQRFELRDTSEQCLREVPSCVEFWVVAESGSYTRRGIS